MAITGIGSNYSNRVYESTYAAQKNEAAKKAETKEAATAQSGSTKSTSDSTIADYYSHLSKNYDCVKNGNVAISGSYLKQCANDSDKAKELEENLAFYKESYKSGYESAKTNAQALGARLVSYSESWSIDSTGNVTMQTSTTVTSDTKGWKELKEEQEERLKEKREKEKQEEKVKEKKEEQQEQLEKLQQSASSDTEGQIMVERLETVTEQKEFGAVHSKKLEDAYYPKFDVGV